MNKNHHLTYIIDLDGTLIKSDLFIESAIKLIKSKPFYMLLFPAWLLRGKAHLKAQIAKHAEIDVALLPYNLEVVDLIRAAKLSGKKIVLATASHKKYANEVANYLDLFDEVIASDENNNLRGKAKADILKSKFPEGFLYAGNEKIDLEIWKVSNQALVVNASKSVIKKLRKLHSTPEIITSKSSVISDVLRAMRPHQWVKNILLFLPLLAAHHWNAVDKMMILAFSFISFSLCASAVYILNDMLDIEADRHHRSKRNRPFAAGSLSLIKGATLLFILMSSSIFIANFFVGKILVTMVLGYFCLALFYSLYAKRIAILDVLVLSSLYTFRVLAGGVIINVMISNWMFMFFMFLFLSLAFVKRYSEILVYADENNVKNVRGYLLTDANLIMFAGVCSGFITVLTMGLYLSNPDITLLYRNISVMWFLLPLLVYWLLYIWLITTRGEMHDDPIIFALKDRTSFLVGIAATIIILLGL